jgi:primosomal protein N' (replication factor Y)
MNSIKPIILEVVLATPVRQSFDYLPPEDWDVSSSLNPGCRVLVPFGRTRRLAFIVKVKRTSNLNISKIKHCFQIIDKQPLLDDECLHLAMWASAYYHYSLGFICFKMLPTLLRTQSVVSFRQLKYWRLTKHSPQPNDITRAPKQRLCVQLLSDSTEGMSDILLKESGITTAQLRNLELKGWLESYHEDLHIEQLKFPDTVPPVLNSEQVLALNQCKMDGFNVHLLDGVTGSGKTEIYIQLIQTTLSKGKQVLILVPEIGLTPQLMLRLQKRLKVPIGLLHSGLSNQQRLETWYLTKNTEYSVLVGTRSALFTPMKQLGLIIIDEEHDPSFKQQQGWQYSARDLALVRAQYLKIPVILGSATASLETLHNAKTGKYHHLKLRQRPGSISTTKFQILDIRKLPIDQGLSKPLIDTIGKHLTNGNQVLIFLNRRGYAPILMCHDCGWMASCDRCSTTYTLHQSPQHLHCHHCDARRSIPRVCPECQSLNITAVGVGTERVEKVLNNHFPDFPLVRIDRDSTRRKDAMKNYIDDIKNEQYKILIGTQMLSKGHHFPGVSLVAIIDMDGALFSADFRAAEKFGQLLTQVAGRAGRAMEPGTVVLQTHHPEHPHLLALLNKGYISFAEDLLTERKQCLWPPFSYLAMFRAESNTLEKADNFLNQIVESARCKLDKNTPISLLGPVAAPMSKRAGQYRSQLLLQATSRQALQKLLSHIIFHLESKKTLKSVRWSLDVDPLEMF